ncbi:MAG: RNA polymerase sigma factor [Isosphaerales bacterium]
MQTESQLPATVVQTTGIRLIHELRAKPNDPACMERIVNHYSPFVWGWATRVAPAQETAEEITQRFYLKLFKHANGSLRLNCSLKPWIGVVVRHIAFDLGRERKRRPRTVSFSEEVLKRIESPESQALLVEQLDRADRWAAIAANLDLAEEWSAHRDELLAYRAQYLRAEEQLLTDSRFEVSTYIAFLLIVREGFKPIDVERELKFKARGYSPGYASKCRSKVEKALLKRMGLEPNEWSRALLELVVRYGRISRLA